MITVRRSDDRGHMNYGWLDTRHTFSFGRYHDPDWMQFRSLRVINEDWVKGGHGFATHPHRDMEIFTYVVRGAITHKDSMGHESTMEAGGIQRMSAGTGVTHSEFNASETDRLHLLQIWLLPDREGHTPSYEEGRIDDEARRNALHPILVGEHNDVSEADHALTLHQDAVVYSTMATKGNELVYPVGEERAAWVQVIAGELQVNGELLRAGDGAGISHEAHVELISHAEDTHYLLFDLA